MTHAPTTADLAARIRARIAEEERQRDIYAGPRGAEPAHTHERYYEFAKYHQHNQNADLLRSLLADAAE